MINKLTTGLKSLSLRQKWVTGGSLAVLVLLGLSLSGKSSDKSSSTDDQLDRYYKVERGDFNISVLTRGELDAIKNYELRFDGKGKPGLRIEQLVPDKSEVKAGEPVISFAAEDYVDQITQLEEDIADLKTGYADDQNFEEELFEVNMRTLEESLDDSELNISLFLEAQSVARDKSISTLTEAGNSYQTAQDALNKYQNLDYRSQRKQKQVAIDTKEQEYYDALGEFDKTNEELAEARLKDADTREKAERQVMLAEKKLNNALAAWETARKADRQFRRYDHPQTERKLLMNADKTELDLKRNLVKAESDRIQAERRYRKLVRDHQNILDRMEEREEKYTEELERLATEFETKLERLTERLAELKEDYAGLILRAPVDGIVTLGAPPKRGREPKELMVGTNVAPKEIVARIPDLSQFLVRCDIPEIYRSRIQTGQIALLKNAALPDLEMQGRINEIATMSQRLNRWDARSPRVYETKISTETTDARLMPGMTVEVEIKVATVQDVLYVPLEAVYNKEGNTYCKRRSGLGGSEEVQISTGRASDSFVEITDGLDEGDTVLLHASGASQAGS
ncbi:HlyD family efflux transporter periplasmic adaptor subunit [Coraliomargarita akajimensis]|uniref:Efflux transporter, RND family, MFP subunit n=1 Tax=Coraliomargarita akajimensis (strain DSM 45221 / IAM 15411 / JCM 23193 / KCTC 12865 / 04OKA010-24) TaxID=583355 RepID=D5ERB2_CORAD|nr:HlyD family efflux transporter periplasmic adaptor subunit [Coraliomargarita akajimensis]ADE55956.1 efflux transporter, RND family, MFP subunit [Coraliomargarita akajimensis DSM 45221]